MMLQVLAQVEKNLRPMLQEGVDAWESLLIDYHHPYVDRLWRQVGPYRVFLHRIHPIPGGDHPPLFHPHSWPSAMRIVRGSYRMALGYGEGDHEPPVAATVILEGGSSYEMTDPNTWHSVSPQLRPVLTLMVADEPWDRSIRSIPDIAYPKKTLGPLDDETKLELLEQFQSHYLTAKEPFYQF